jgi:palmitoyl transferase
MYVRLYLLILSLCLWGGAAWSMSAEPFRDFWEDAKHRLYQIWTEGHGDLYIPNYAWHNRLYYDADKLSRYNEFPWGAGFGKGIWDEHNNWQGLYAIVFMDSHSNIQPMAGYGYLLTHHLTENAGVGIGFTLMMTARQDIMNYTPFPGILPLASINYKNILIMGAYVPGTQNIGNVLFIMTKLTLT